MQITLHRVADLSATEIAALQELSAAVYPREIAATWPGLAIERAPATWCVVCRDDDGRALCGSSHCCVGFRAIGETESFSASLGG
jgi:hypothetical protein